MAVERQSNKEDQVNIHCSLLFSVHTVTREGVLEYNRRLFVDTMMGLSRFLASAFAGGQSSALALGVAANGWPWPVHIHKCSRVVT